MKAFTEIKTKIDELNDADLDKVPVDEVEYGKHWLNWVLDGSESPEGFKPESRKYIMYANTSVGRYGYTLIDIGSRYNRGHIRLSDEIIDKILEEASQYYPIVIIDGYSLDGLLDAFSLGKASVIQSFGEYPRKVTSTGDEHRVSSIEEFKKYFRSSKAVARIIQEDLEKIQQQVKEHNRSIAYHEGAMKKESSKLEEATRKLTQFREKWKTALLKETGVEGE